MWPRPRGEHKFVSWTQNKVSEISARRATMMPRFVTNNSNIVGHKKTQGTLWHTLFADVIMLQTFCYACSISDGHKNMFLKTPEAFPVSVRCATTLPRFIRNGNVVGQFGRLKLSSFCRGLTLHLEPYLTSLGTVVSKLVFWVGIYAQFVSERHICRLVNKYNVVSNSNLRCSSVQNMWVK